eukprot:2427622-Rhodomonas_salina.1
MGRKYGGGGGGRTCRSRPAGGLRCKRFRLWAGAPRGWGGPARASSPCSSRWRCGCRPWRRCGWRACAWRRPSWARASGGGACCRAMTPCPASTLPTARSNETCAATCGPPCGSRLPRRWSPPTSSSAPTSASPTTAGWCSRSRP